MLFGTPSNSKCCSKGRSAHTEEQRFACFASQVHLCSTTFPDFLRSPGSHPLTRKARLISLKCGLPVSGKILHTSGKKTNTQKSETYPIHFKLTYFQHLHHLDVSCGHVHRTLFVIGRPQPTHLQANSPVSSRESQADETGTARNWHGNHADLRSHSIFCL